MKQDDMQHSIESASFMWFCKRIIGPKEDPYLIRWIILQTPFFSIYIHKMVRSDYERALHDHPWGFMSFVLSPYWETYDPKREGGGLHTRMKKNRRFSLLFRPATWQHRVIIPVGDPKGWTIVLTGPRSRKWGFWPKTFDGLNVTSKWCHWKKFNQELAICESEPIAGRTGLD